MAKFPHFRRGIAQSGRPMREGRYGDHLDQTTGMLNGGLEEGDIDAKGNFKSGNSRDYMAEVTFEQADTDTFIPHSLGYIVENWQVVRKSCPGDIYDGSKPAIRTGIWLRCTTVPCTARIRMFGQRKDERR
jgi:hypothetical protein